MKTIGIVAEGPHDFELIAALIDTITNEENSYQMIQPEPDMAGRFGNGWKGVWKWCETNQGRLNTYEVLSDPWANIITHAPQYHGIKIRNRPHKAKRTYEGLISVVCDNWSDVVAKCPQAKRFDEDVRRFLIK